MQRGSAGVDDTVRRTWDTAVFAKKAEERRRAEEEAERERERARDASRPNRDDPFAPSRAWLAGRQSSIDVDSKVGKTELVPGARDKRSGFFCEICNSLQKDSHAYLNHLNSRIHQKNLGMSMRVERSSVQDVKDRLAAAAQQKKKEQPVYNFDARVKEQERKSKQLREERKLRRKAGADGKKTENVGDTTEGKADSGAVAGSEDETDEQAKEIKEMAAVMGLPMSFSSKQKR